MRAAGGTPTGTLAIMDRSPPTTKAASPTKGGAEMLALPAPKRRVSGPTSQYEAKEVIQGAEASETRLWPSGFAVAIANGVADCLQEVANRRVDLAFPLGGPEAAELAAANEKASAAAEDVDSDATTDAMEEDAGAAAPPAEPIHRLGIEPDSDPELTPQQEAEAAQKARAVQVGKKKQA